MAQHFSNGLFIILLSIILFSIYLLLLYDFNDKKLIKITNRNKSILYWNNFFSQNDMRLGLGHKIFENCSVNTCFTTNNKSMMPVEDFDAVMIHMARYSRKKDGIPSKRNLNQKYIFYSLESAFNTYFDNDLNKNFFNWTMTFRRDSDIYFPYAVVYKVESNFTFNNNLNNRTSKIAWFVSNCHMKTTKKRMDYVKELQKYIPVDIYGNCGKYKCPRSDDCYKMLEKNYKFYLAFENSMCGDYATEKLFNVLNYNVVPIVMGGANYSIIAPPYSCINTDDFQSPEELAEYLWMLDENDGDYIEYFEWKNNYFVQNYDNEFVLCQLCASLHTPLTYTWYENVKDWFYKNNCHL